LARQQGQASTPTTTSVAKAAPGPLPKPGITFTSISRELGDFLNLCREAVSKLQDLIATSTNYKPGFAEMVQLLDAPVRYALLPQVSPMLGEQKKRVVVCMASFNRDEQLKITLPLNLLMNMQRMTWVSFFLVTFGDDLHIHQWIQEKLSWVWS
jgi:hypothetical protein